jgi:glycosyltransferase involved in cell wall biosynthesis
MDLVAEMLAGELRQRHSCEFEVASLRPPFKRRFSRVPIVGERNSARMLDRVTNRMCDYSRWLRNRAGEFDIFHIADHSYSQLVHELPADRTGVFCHDLDTFRCLIEPERDPRSRWFKAMARRILQGMQRARVVFHTTETIRAQILKHGLIDPARLVHAPYGISPEFTTEASNVELPPEAACAVANGFLLHVGSCIPRKRIDVLLDVFAEIAQSDRQIHLIQVGGEWTDVQRKQIQDHGIVDRVTQLGRQDRTVVAELYRRSRMVLMPSEAEGFGLPVAEALACGTVVIASDIPVLREVGGEAGIYCAVGNVDAWSGRIRNLISGTTRLSSSKSEVPQPLDVRLARAARYSWVAHADIIARTYLGFF